MPAFHILGLLAFVLLLSLRPASAAAAKKFYPLVGDDGAFVRPLTSGLTVAMFMDDAARRGDPTVARLGRERLAVVPFASYHVSLKPDFYGDLVEEMDDSAEVSAALTALQASFAMEDQRVFFRVASRRTGGPGIQLQLQREERRRPAAAHPMGEVGVEGA